MKTNDSNLNLTTLLENGFVKAKVSMSTDNWDSGSPSFVLLNKAELINLWDSVKGFFAITKSMNGASIESITVPNRLKHEMYYELDTVMMVDDDNAESFELAVDDEDNLYYGSDDVNDFCECEWEDDELEITAQGTIILKYRGRYTDDTLRAYISPLMLGTLRTDEERNELNQVQVVNRLLHSDNAADSDALNLLTMSDKVQSMVETFERNLGTLKSQLKL